MDRIRNAAVFKELTPRTFAVFLFISIGAVNFGFGRSTVPLACLNMHANTRHR